MSLRFRPVRAGIVNLYQYADQVFELAGGRMLLRGHNTSGKTKALELLLPFCLDGDISPHKLDPFAKSAKDMKWNLVGCVDGEQRVGYTWLEFQRVLADGSEQHVTVGVGMKANRGREGVERWYFVLPDRRVGVDLVLRRGDQPLIRRDFADQLGDGEELLGTASQYRQRLNDVLFGFPSLDQYRTMVNLLLELRRPHLSKGLDHKAVRQLLSASMPEVDHELMRRLGEGLEQLDALQAALAQVREAEARVRAFHRNTYRAYARATVAERGERLRGAEAAFERASTARREAAETDAAAQADVGLAETAHQQARRAREVAEGEHAALISSAEWSTVAEIESLARTAAAAAAGARSARGRHDDAAGRLVADEADAIAAGAAEQEAAERRDDRLRELAELATAAGLAARHGALATQLSEAAVEPERWVGLARQEATAWEATLGAHGRLVEALAAAEAALAQRRERLEAARDRHRSAAERVAQLEAVAAEHAAQLASAVNRWLAGLGELVLDADADDRVRELALDAGQAGAQAPSAVWAAPVQRLHEAWLTRRVAIDAELAGHAAEATELDEERARLAAEGVEAPIAPPTRPASRADRPGAPLWRLVDFRAGLAPERQAALEAALEAAGLLDAWVTPAGEALDPETLDVALTATGRAGDHDTLGSVLVPEPDSPVAADVVQRLLAAVALVDDPHSAPAGCAISLDGAFRLGPATGRFAKPAAEWIGAGARKARRRRRVGEIDARVVELASLRATLEGELAALRERRQRLDAELAAFPDLAALAGARRESALAATYADALAAELAGHEHEVASAVVAREAADAQRAQHAAAQRLPDGPAAGWLAGWREATGRYRAEVPVAAEAERSARAARGAAAERRERVEAGRAEAERLGREAGGAEAQARRLEAEHAEREAALGSSGDQLRERGRALTAALEAARTAEEQAADAKTAAAVAATRHAERLSVAEAGHATARDARASALEHFCALEAVDLIVLALDDDAPPDHEHAASWTLTRALEALRAMPAERLRVSSSLPALANQVQRACGELDRSLGAFGDLRVTAQTSEDGVIAVRIADGARERGVLALLDDLGAEISQRERTLTGEQRRVFGDTLLEEIAEHLRERIGRVDTLVSEMNTTLAGCPTGSGRTIALEWRPKADDDGRLASVCRLLRRSIATLGEGEREPLVAFFRERVQAARDAAETAAEAGAASHLRTAFDYRDWFEFDLLEVHGGQRNRLTAKRHAVGSGGEQAVLVHMPLFAAAAALYASSLDGRAPRLVMLDEALSGIDDETREKVMSVLVTLDLDFVMTSHELWGTYRTVPQLAIYQLHRDNDLFGVAAERFLWDGDLLREGEQAAIGL